jgi:subtilisin family serine protease
VVAVGATDAEDDPAEFTPKGAPWVDLVAPGVQVESTYLSGDVQARLPVVKEGRHVRTPITNLGTFTGAARWSGTSFAAADATGEIARLMLEDKDRTPWEALAEIRKHKKGAGEVHGVPD